MFLMIALRYFHFQKEWWIYDCSSNFSVGGWNPTCTVCYNHSNETSSAVHVLSHCVVPENIHTTPTEGICCMIPPSPLEFPKLAPKIYPPPFQISKIFAHPLELLLSLIEENKLVVLFTRVPHFVSFMYFLLNSITDKRICHALKLQCILNKFLATRK